MTNDIWHIPDVHISLHLTLSHPCSAPGWHPCDGFRSVWFHHKVKLTRVDTSGWSPFMTGEIAHQSRDSCTEGRHSQDHGTKGTGLHTLWYWTSLLVTLDITLCDTGLHTLWHWTSHLVTLDFTPCDTGLHTLCDIDASAKERGSPLSLHPCQCCSLSHRKHQGQHPPTFGVSFRHNSANQYYLVGYNGYNGYNGGWPSAR